MFACGTCEARHCGILFVLILLGGTHLTEQPILLIAIIVLLTCLLMSDNTRPEEALPTPAPPPLPPLLTERPNNAPAAPAPGLVPRNAPLPHGGVRRISVPPPDGLHDEGPPPEVRQNDVPPPTA